MSNSRLLITGLVIATVSAAAGYYLHHRSGDASLNRGQMTDARQIPGQSVAPLEEMTGKHRPPFTLPDLSGRMREVSEWDGKILLINFWATWCPPCKQEIPELMELQGDYADQGLQVLGIALQEAEDIRDFVEAMDINYPVLTGELPVIEIAQRYGNRIGALPYTVIIDRNQVIQFIKAGAITYAEAEKAINRLLLMSSSRKN